MGEGDGDEKGGWGRVMGMRKVVGGKDDEDERDGWKEGGWEEGGWEEGGWEEGGWEEGGWEGGGCDEESGWRGLSGEKKF